MKLQVLVAAVEQDVSKIADKMNLQSDAIIINQHNRVQYNEYSRHGYKIRCFTFNERGVGLSRNNALLRANADIVLFSDEDIVYDDGYAEKILNAFEENPDADMLLFNIDVCAERATYNIIKKTRVKIYNSGRYPTYSFAVRREKLHSANITFSLLFGGGAKYCSGEDTLFIRDCIKNKFKIYAIPIKIGTETVRKSTWFEGYTEKYFFDRGVLYYYLYGKFSRLLTLRFLLTHKHFLSKTVNFKKAYSLMCSGIKHARNN